MAAIVKTTNRQNWDSPWKEVIEDCLQDFLELCFPHIAEKIDWSKGYEFLDKELEKLVPHSIAKKRIMDKLVKLWGKTGTPFLALLHVEIQGNQVADFAKRVFIYDYRAYDKFDLPLTTIVILIDNNPNWRPFEHNTEFWGTKLHYQFNIVKLLDYKNKKTMLESSENPFAVVILAQLEAMNCVKLAPDMKLASKIRLLRMLYAKGFSKIKVMNILRFIDWIIQLPDEHMVEYLKTAQAIEQEKKMTYITSIERFVMKRGLEEGLQKGLQKGRQEGEAEILLILLNQKFPRVPKKYQDMIRGADAKQLKVYAKRILNAESLEEIFKLAKKLHH